MPPGRALVTDGTELQIALVAGSPRSGRTTTLHTIARRLAPVRQVGWLAGRAAPDALPPEVTVLDAGCPDAVTGAIVCVNGQTSTLTTAFRGVIAELRRRQTGIILQPGRRDGELLGADTGPPERPRPGHGALVIRGRVVELQVAT